MANTTFRIAASRDGSQRSIYQSGEGPITITASGALAAQAAVMLGAGVVTTNGAALFVDDFSSGDLSSANDYFRWGTGAPPAAGYESANVVDVTGPTGATIKARRFRYPAGVHQVEQRFHLTTTLAESRTADGSSNTAYNRACFGFDWFIPSNYSHQTGLPNAEGSGNNKWMMDLWKDQYGHSAELSKVLAMTEAWPTGDGQSRVRIMWANPGPGAPEANGTSSGGMTVGASRAAPGGQAYAVKTSDLGKWAHIVLDMKASDIDQTNGWMRWYRAEYVSGVKGAYELMYAKNDADNSTSAGTVETNGFDRGYLMGYSNSTYAEETTFLLSNMKFALTPESVGLVI